MHVTTMEYASRKLTSLQTKIEGLGPNEHGVILDMVQRAGVSCAQNTNGFFFDLAALSQDLLQSIEDFVSFSVDNNKSLAVHDRCMHDQLKLLQRIPAAQLTVGAQSPAAKRPPRTAAPVQQVAQPEAVQRGSRLAFVRRACDAPVRRRADDDVLEEPVEPVFLNRGRRDF